MKLTDYPRYVRFWAASTVSGFGTYITTIAINVIVVLRLGGDGVDVGFVNAARWLPYPLLGLLAGVWIDRHRRKPILVAGDFGRGMIIVSISVLGLTHTLTVPLLEVHMLVFGVLSLVSDAAYQSFVPQLVPRELLVRANARLEQSASVAQTTGPALAGWVTQLLSAPAALLIDAISYFVSGFVVASIPSSSAPLPAAAPGNVGRQIREGLRWVYRHPRLGPLTWTTHLWFLSNSMFSVVFTVYALRERDMGPGGLGVVLAFAGAGAVLGTVITTRVGDRLGAGRTIILGRLVYAPAFAIIIAAGATSPDAWTGFAGIAFGQLLIGFGLGLEGPQEMGYQQAVTPDRLMGRMSATKRSINRGMIVIGAPLGGFVAGAVGNRPAMAIAAAGMVLVVVLLAASDARHARMADQLTEDEASAV
ncbi:MAG: MFS transporter [bacterium]